MTQQDLDELCGKPEVTPQILMELKNEEWFFEQIFSGNVSPLMKEPLRAWMDHNFFKGRPIEEPKP